MTINRRTLLAGALGGLLAPAPISRARARGRLHLVAIRGFAFVPDQLAVRPGDQIRFTNDDLAPHTATARDGSWDTGPLAQGESTELTVTPDWSAEYFCAFHPSMTARLRIG